MGGLLMSSLKCPWIFRYHINWYFFAVCLKKFFWHTVPWVHSRPLQSGRSTGRRTISRPPSWPPGLHSYHRTQIKIPSMSYIFSFPPPDAATFLVIVHAVPICEKPEVLRYESDLRLFPSMRLVRRTPWPMPQWSFSINTYNRRRTTCSIFEQ